MYIPEWLIFPGIFFILWILYAADLTASQRHREAIDAAVQKRLDDTQPF